jgi:molybdenum cofactor cytidylyltransferase
MIACAYANTMGTPVLFDKMYFGHLKALEESEGAKGLLKNYKDDVALFISRRVALILTQKKTIKI